MERNIRGQFKRGYAPWNKGKHTGNYGNGGFKKGYIPSEKTRQKIREAREGEPSGMLGKRHSEKTKKKIGLANSIALKGEKSSFWKGGISYEPYGMDWTETLKETIRQRDGYICQKCGRTQEEELKKTGKRLSIHHIDYNKKNCNPDNLITLCRGCNAEVNFNREYWTKQFLEILEVGRRCFFPTLPVHL